MFVTFIADHRGKHAVPTTLVSKYLKLSHRYLEIVAKQLKGAGILKSYRGSAGGYRLNKKNINMLDIIEAIDGPIAILRCTAGTGCSVMGKCPSKSIWPELQNKIIEVLKETKIS